MQAIKSSELLQAIDAYDLLLNDHSDIVPVGEFTVLQCPVDGRGLMDRVNIIGIDALPPASGTDTDLQLTLRRLKPTSNVREYVFTMLNRVGEGEIPRLSQSRLKRLGSALTLETFVLDRQLLGTESRGQRLKRLHIQLMGNMLTSAAAQQKLVETQDRLDDVNRKKRESDRRVAFGLPRDLSPNELLGLNQAIKNTKLK